MILPTENQQAENQQMLMREWVTVKELLQDYPVFSEASLRSFLWRRKENGLDEHVRKLGKKMIVDRIGFNSWLESQPS